MKNYDLKIISHSNVESAIRGGVVKNLDVCIAILSEL